MRNLPANISFSYEEIWSGILATGPLFAFNFGVFGILANIGSRYSVYREFRDEIVYPLCVNLGVGGALILGVFSGLGEELFFRGVLNNELSTFLPLTLAITISSLLFAYVHFIGMLKRFFVLISFYFLFGLYFSYLALRSNDLTSAIVAHSLYNFLAALMVPIFYRDKKRKSASNN